MKVYGFRGWRSEAPRMGNGSQQTREIVAAPSLAAAARAFGVSAYALKQSSGPTANPEEVETAMAEPGVVFWRGLDARDGGWTRAR